MFIATHAARSGKLRRSGTYSRSLGHCWVYGAKSPKSCRSYGAWRGIWGGRYYKHGAPNGV